MRTLLPAALAAAFVFGYAPPHATAQNCTMPSFSTGSVASGSRLAFASVTGDFNGDGHADIATTHYNANVVSVALGNGNGTFVAGVDYAAGSSPHGLAAGDVDGDGDLDLAVAATNSDVVHVFLGNGDGTFQAAVPYATGSYPHGVALADLDRDGDLDLAVANNIGSSVSVLLGNGNGTFGAQTAYPSGASSLDVVVGDWNRDGKLDLAVAVASGAVASVLLGVGDGTFQSAVSYPVPSNAPQQIVSADFNRDGVPDLAVLERATSDVQVLLGVGDGTFGSPTVHTLGSANYASDLAVGEFDHDGLTDLVASTDAGEIYFLSGNGDGTFDAPVLQNASLPTLAVVVGDWDEDGHDDLALGTISGSLEIWRNTFGATCQNASFAAAAFRPSGKGGRDLAVGDFDRDGRPDLVAPNINAVTMSILLGTGETVAGPAESAYSVAVGDFDRDGKLDLAYGHSNLSGGFVSIARGNGDATFGAPVDNSVTGYPEKIRVGDWNSDGRLDLAVACPDTGSHSIAILLGNGDGTFQSAAPYSVPQAWALAAGDLNGDTVPDLVAGGSGAAEMRILLGNGDGTFQPNVASPLALTIDGIELADVNHDAKLDAILGSSSGEEIDVQLGNGDGTVGAITGVHVAGIYGSRALAVADVNRDGDPDVIAANKYGEGLAVLTGIGDGFFNSAVSLPVSASTVYGLVATDLDGDGRPDIALTSYNDATIAVLTNTNCKGRRAALTTNVSRCNAPATPFGTQPSVVVSDDGGNAAYCSISSVTASLVPGTGTEGAELGGTTTLDSDVSAQVPFTDLSVDLPGHGYRLAFSVNGLVSAVSDPFSQGLGAPSILGPTTLGAGATVFYSPDANYDFYDWKVDGNTVSGLKTAAVSGLSVGAHTLTLDATADTCSLPQAQLALDVQTPALSINDVTVTESTLGSVNAVFTVKSSIAGGAITVHYQTANGTAVSPGDYVATGGTLTFAPGVTSRTFAVAIPADSVPELTKTFYVDLDAPANAVISKARGQAWILDRAVAQRFLFSSASYVVKENGGKQTITVFRRGATAGTVTVAFATSDGTASAPARYTATSGTLVFGPGVTSRTFQVTVANNGSVDGDKTVALRLGAVTGPAALGLPATAILTIQEDDARTVQLTSASYSTPEGTKSIITVTRKGPLSGFAGVSYATSDGTAVAGTHYQSANSFFSFAAGQSSRTFSITTMPDGLDDGDHTVQIALSSPFNMALGSVSSAVLTIQDKDVGGVLQFTQPSYPGLQSAGNITVTVKRTGGAAKDVTVDFTTSNGTATQPTHYTSTSGTLSFSAGATSRTFNVPVQATGPGDDRYFVLSLSNPAGGATVGPLGAATGVIKSGAPELEFTKGAYTVPQTASFATITVKSTGPATAVRTVDYMTTNGTAADGQDYTGVSGTLTFAAGVTSRTFKVPILDDGMLAGDETVLMAIGNTTPAGTYLGVLQVAVLTILSDDPVVRLSSAAYSATEASGKATITAIRSGPANRAVTVDYQTSDGTAIGNVNYVPAAGTLSFGVGVTSRTFSVALLRDTIDGATRVASVALSNPQEGARLGSPAAATLQILDSDAGGNIQFAQVDFSASESGPSAAIVVTRTGGAASGVTVDYATSDGTAVVGVNYLAASGTLSFAAGETSKTFWVRVLDDGAAYPNHTVNLTLPAVSGGATVAGPRSSATLWIVENR